MTTGYILILAVLILGGAIATAGDRIGTKVGKAWAAIWDKFNHLLGPDTVYSSQLYPKGANGVMLEGIEEWKEGLW